ncbi:hypothetical protein B0H14DRAFT_3851608, partial [Mycena olivaceomarginata]
MSRPRSRTRRGGSGTNAVSSWLTSPGQHSPGPAASHLRGQAARGRAHAERLQHPKGVDAPPRAASPWRHHRAVAQGARQQVQLRQADLPQVLRTPASPCDQLPQALVRTLQPAPAEEEAQVVVCCIYYVSACSHPMHMRSLW